MPTFDTTDEFRHDWDRLTPEQKRQFRAAIKLFVSDLRGNGGIRTSLGGKRFKRRKGAWEFAWAADGRALFRYGTSPHQGEAHIIWEAIGTHNIYKR